MAELNNTPIPDLTSPLLSVQDIHSQGEVIACLEKGLVREAEEQPGAHAIKEDCKKSIMRVAELSSDDFHLDRYLYFACREDRERFCENVRFEMRDLDIGECFMCSFVFVELLTVTNAVFCRNVFLYS